MGADQDFWVRRRRSWGTAHHRKREVVNALLYLLTTKNIPLFNGSAVFLPLAGRRVVADDQPFSVMRTHEVAAAEEAPRPGHRQPVGQDDRGRWPARVRCRRKSKSTSATAHRHHGLPVGAVVHDAGVQDRDGLPLVLAAARDLYPWLRHIFAGGAKLGTALNKIARWTIEIVSAPTPLQDLWSNSGVGLSSAPSPGSTAIDASPKTSKPPWKALSPSCFSPASSYSSDDSAEYNSNSCNLSQTLKSAEGSSFCTFCGQRNAIQNRGRGTIPASLL